MNTAGQYENAAEVWMPFDTVNIGEDQSKVNGSHWYESFAALAAEDQISVFNTRNRSQVGLAYTNMDTAGQLPYAFKAYSIGVQVTAPSVSPVIEYSYNGTTLVGPTLDLASHAHAIFSGELVKHASVRLQVSQDEKLVNTVQGTPSGSGVAGIFDSKSSVALDGKEIGGVQCFSNGIPELPNRFKFPTPISIPRNHIFNVSIKFSSYAREILKRLSGPGRIMVNLAPDLEWTIDDATVPAVCQIRVSLFGVRYVQQRNQLHY